MMHVFREALDGGRLRGRRRQERRLTESRQVRRDHVKAPALGGLQERRLALPHAPIKRKTVNQK